jgi:DNA-binding response OmpR family regulator
MVHQGVVLTADRNQRNLELLKQFLENAGFSTMQASSVEEIYDALKGPEVIALALVDISGFDRSIWECCEQMKAKSIPLMILSPKHSMAIQQESLMHGARGVLVKPLVVKEMLALVQSLIED